jgi:hypothetical protein
MSTLQKSARIKKFNSHDGQDGTKVLPYGLDWLFYLAVVKKGHRGNSIYYIFLQSPHKLDIKNVIKYWKNLLWHSSNQ